MKFSLLIAITCVGSIVYLVAQDPTTRLIREIQESSLDQKKLEQLLSRGLNLMQSGERALLEAILNKDVKTTRLLQSYGALPGDASIAMTVLLDDQEILKLIITKGLTPWAIGNFDKEFILCLQEYAEKKNLKVANGLKVFTEQLVQFGKQRLTPHS